MSLLHSSTGVSSVPSAGKGEEGAGSSVCITSLLCGISLSSIWAMQADEPGCHALAREVIADLPVTGSSPAPNDQLRGRRSSLVDIT